MEFINYLIKRLEGIKAKDIIVHHTKAKTKHIKFYNSKIGVVNEFYDEGISLFLAFDKKILITDLKEISKNGIDNKIKKIKNIISYIPEKEDYFGIAEGNFKYRNKTGLYDKEVENFDKAIEISEDSINTALNQGAERVAGVLDSSIIEKRVISNKGVNAIQKETITYLSIRSLVKNASGHTTSISRNFNGLKHKKRAAESAEIALQGLKKEKIKIGKYDIIYYPLAASSIIESIGEASSIFSLETGTSCFRGMLNKKVGSNNITLIDDPTNNKIPGSKLFDDEGVPTQKNTIIEQGIFKKFLHNTSTAKKYKTKTTANAGLISPEPHLVVLKQGDSNLEEMIRTTKKGLIITNTWYTRFQNYAKGDFSTLPRDTIMIVKNGSISGSTQGIRINDNLIRMMKNTSLIAKETVPTTGWETSSILVLPIFKVDNVLITRPK
ncbi:MAG: TldD/PmbA family protein [Candidatus Woesearchaeota archaeon]